MDSIFNRPPSISEDTLEYNVFPSLSDDASTSQSACTALAAQIQAKVNEELLPRDFLWHRDAFELNVVPRLAHELSASSSNSRSNAPGTLWKLEGRMRIGDSVNDEWATVWLWREITKEFDVVVSIYDSDGEFLLIEAADSLPAWVSPSNAENRVWLYRNRLHLVPIFYHSASSVPRVKRQLPGTDAFDTMDEPSSNSTEDEDYLGVADALRLVFDASVDTIAPDEVQARVWERLSVYPNAFSQHVHRAKAYIPQDIALALSNDPSLVQRAVETFYTRDAIQLRAVHSMSRFPPLTSVLATVRLTRPAYAQLVGQKFHPPKVFGRWTEREGTTGWKRKDVGMKIACGFEMLYTETKSKSLSQEAANTPDQSALKSTLRNDQAYQQYIQNLKKVYFFKGELEGSALWNELEDKAIRTWVATRTNDASARKSFALSVNEAIERRKAQIPSSAPTSVFDDEPEDSDEWLNIDIETLDGMLAKRSDPKASSSSAPSKDADGDEEMTNGQAERLHQLAGKVESFVEGEGGLEGAELPDDLLSDEEFSDGEDDNSDSDSDSEEDEWTTTVPTAEMEQRRKEATDKLVAPLPAEEYGVMPASYRHANSQTVRAPTMESESAQPPPPFTESDTQSKSQSQSQPRPSMRRPILMRDKYDGVDSDDESDEDEDADGPSGVVGDDDEEEDEEDRPQVVGEIEVDMEAEEEEFLRFSREALGITDSQWEEILQERSSRGAFVPATAAASAGPGSGRVKERSPSPPPAPAPAGPNPDLDSFEAVMQAMDDALATHNRATNKSANPPKSSSTSTPSATNQDKRKGKGKERAAPISMEDILEETGADDDDDDAIEAAMAAELKAALEAHDDSDSENELGEDAQIDYNLIKNFLKSFKAQEGLAGPASNLAGRLEKGVWPMPRDDS